MYLLIQDLFYYRTSFNVKLGLKRSQDLSGSQLKPHVIIEANLMIIY